MAERDFELEFQEIVRDNWLRPAATDPRVKQLVRWLLHKNDEPGLEAGIDYYNLMNYIHDTYGLNQDEFGQVLEICETQVIQEMQHGQT